jgi:hypothetical protein
MLIKLTGLSGWSGGTASSGLFQLPGLRKTLADNSTYMYDLAATYGENPFEAGSMTTVGAAGYCLEHQAMLDAVDAITVVRPIASAININVTSEDSSNSGMFQAYHSEVPLDYWHLTGTTASHVFNTNGAICTTPIGRVYSAKEGITVRSAINSEGLSWIDNDVGFASMDAGEKLPWGGVPTVAFSGLGGGTQLTIQYVYYYEVKVTSATMFLHGKSQSEADFIGLRGWLNSFPFTTTGHSFAGFLSAVSKYAGLLGTTMTTATGQPAWTALGNSLGAAAGAGVILVKRRKKKRTGPKNQAPIASRAQWRVRANAPQPVPTPGPNQKARLILVQDAIKAAKGQRRRKYRIKDPYADMPGLEEVD